MKLIGKGLIVFICVLHDGLFPACAVLDKTMPTIVFIHIGKKMPSYLPIAIAQARLFNDCNIALIAHQDLYPEIESLCSQNEVFYQPYEKLKKSSFHKQFLKKTKLDRNFREGFWLYASERFFYLEELIELYGLTDLFHLESDVMLYEDVKQLLPIFHKYYPGFGVTMDTDQRCIPGFVYISRTTVMRQLVKYMAAQVNTGLDDMFCLGGFRRSFGTAYMEHLPIVDKKYIENEKVDSIEPYNFSKYCDEFDSIFDAAYLGQFLGGIDPRNEVSDYGYVNPHCVIKSSLLEFSWEKDAKGRKIPFAHYKDTKRKINNLHIHSKRLAKFYSGEGYENEK